MFRINQMIKFLLVIFLVSCIAVGCAGTNVKPIIDMKGVSQEAYDKDLQECQTIAQQQSGMGENAAKGVGLGAVVGGLLGLVTGGNVSGIAQAAGAGAVVGGAGGAYSGNQSQESVVKRCLSGRGYKVLN